MRDGHTTCVQRGRFAREVRLDGRVQRGGDPQHHIAAGRASRSAARCGERLLRPHERDRRLVELARGGDERAFELIITRYRPLLLSHCRRIVGDASAQDVLQQTSMNAWCALRGGCEVHSLRAWLFTIAHRAALELRRGSQRQADELSDALPGDRGPHEHVERTARARAVLAAVAELPHRERDALVLTSVHGHSGRATARALGVSEIALRQLVFRARARARELAGATALVPPVCGLRAGLGARIRRGLAHRGIVQRGVVHAPRLSHAVPTPTLQLLSRVGPLLATGTVASLAATAVLGPHHVPPRRAALVSGQAPAAAAGVAGASAVRAARASIARAAKARASSADSAPVPAGGERPSGPLVAVSRSPAAQAAPRQAASTPPATFSAARAWAPSAAIRVTAPVLRLTVVRVAPSSAALQVAPAVLPGQPVTIKAAVGQVTNAASVAAGALATTADSAEAGARVAQQSADSVTVAPSLDVTRLATAPAAGGTSAALP